VPTRPEDKTTERHRPPDPAGRAPAGPALVVAFPQGLALRLPPTGEVVGRAWLAAHGIIDAKTSRRHLVFTKPGGVLRVADAGSENGTWLAGARLPPDEPVPLDEGAVLRVGTTVLVYRSALERLEPDPPLGRLVGPFGLRAVRAAIEEATGRGRDGAKNVLIEGETGTGKELVAELVARALRGPRAPFAAVNTAAIPAGVFEAQLFGWRRGAYSGSAEGGVGLFVANEHGSVFLDEIGELSPELQPKLLRVLAREREVLAVGDVHPRRVDLTILAATNRDVDRWMQEDRFRRDLLARFDTRIRIPPLRERVEDLPAIAAALLGRPFSATSEVEAVERLLLHAWPSNVRELEAALTGIDPDLRLDALA
jgi:hypothetical protein